MEPYSKRPSDPRQPGAKRKIIKWWWFYLILLAVLFFPYLSGLLSPVTEINWQQFEKDILSRKAVERIVVVNNERAEVYIKKEFANDSLFKEVFKPAFGKGLNAGPHYSFNIGSVESFERKLDEAEKNFPANER